jgi:hypothetical protein
MMGISILCAEISFVAKSYGKHGEKFVGCGAALAVHVVGERTVLNRYQRGVGHGVEGGNPQLLGEAWHLYVVPI